MFRIGEFSKIAQVATSQLRFYDRIGLFQPELTDDSTGYRYYHGSQLPELNRILAMKELGLSLEQIQELVADNVSVEALRGMLALRKAQVQEELHAQITRLHHIEARLRQVEEKGEVTQDDVVLKSLPARPFYGFRAILPDMRQVRSFIFELNKLLPRQIGSKKLGYLTVLQHSDSFMMENTDIEIGHLANASITKSLQLSHGQQLTMRELPPIETVACVVRLGGPDKSYACYDSLGRWAEANGYEVGGPIQEVFIVPPRPNHMAETVCEIQMPVKLRERPSLLIS